MRQGGGSALYMDGRHESNIKEAQVLCTAKQSEWISLSGCKNNVTPDFTPIRLNVTLVVWSRRPRATSALRLDKQHNTCQDKIIISDNSTLINTEEFEVNRGRKNTHSIHRCHTTPRKIKLRWLLVMIRAL